MEVVLSEEIQRRLNEAALRCGEAAETYAGRLIETALQSPANGQNHIHKPHEATLALLAEWEKEDQTDDPAELERRRREFEELKQALNDNREAVGARKLFP